MSDAESESENELSEDELNSLLQDLESKSAGGGDVDLDEADQDIDAFLEEVEQSDGGSAASEAATAQAERDEELEARFAELDGLADDDLPAKGDVDLSSLEASGGASEDTSTSKSSKDGSGKKSKEKEKAESEDSDSEESSGKKKEYLVKALKLAGLSLPVVLLTWLVGSFLGNWVSAAWLIAIVAIGFSLGVPALLKRYVKKGKFSWWAVGSSLVLMVVLTVPISNQAGNSIQKYGHWPASFVAEVAGWEPDAVIVDVTSEGTEAIGGLLVADELVQYEGKQLGTNHDLDVPVAETSAGGATE